MGFRSRSHSQPKPHSFGEQQAARLLQADLLLELDRRERRHRLEMPVKAWNAHMRKRREIGNPHRLGEVVANPRSGATDTRGMTVGEAELPQVAPNPPPSSRQTISRRIRGARTGKVARRVEQRQQSRERIAQIGVELGGRQRRDGDPSASAADCSTRSSATMAGSMARLKAK